MPSVLLDLTLLRTATRMRGIGRYAADLARSAAHEVSVHPRDFTLLGLERLSFLSGCVVSHDLPALVDRLNEHRRATSHANFAYRVRFSLARASASQRADLVHSPHPEATPLRELRCPRIVTAHDLIELRFPREYAGWRVGFGPGRKLIDRRRYQRAARVIAVSQATADDLVGMLGIDSRKITVVYNGVDTERFSALSSPNDALVRAELGLDLPYLFYTGGADWRKNAEGMFAALAEARRHRGAHELGLVWCGALSDSELSRLKKSASEQGAGSAVRFVGYLTDEKLAAVARGAIAALFISRAEGFGYPIVEAMALGCPVITSNRSSMREIAADAAIQVDPDDVARAASAIIDLSRDATARRQLIDRGTRRASEFSLVRMARATLDVYQSVLSKP